MIFRVQKNKNYTTMSNYHLRDKNISLKAKGLLSWMLSNNDDWDYSIAGIVACCKEGETTINTALRELQEFGYVKISKVYPDDKVNRIHYEYNVYEQPQDIYSQGVESLVLESQELENQVQRNTKERNTNKKKISISKDIDNKEIEWFLENYHSICVSLPKVMKVTDRRKKAILKILKVYSKEDILRCFELAEESDFLKGDNERGWKADIDFILRNDKFVSILEGKYGGKKRTKSVGRDIEHMENVVRTTDEEKEYFRKEIRNGNGKKY